MYSALETYRTELLRWNEQISLVSREQPESRVAALLGLCAAGRSALQEGAEAVAPEAAAHLAGGRFGYVDIGSGGGLPGIPWRLMEDGGVPGETWLVEPREKRAWFLDRIVHLLRLRDTRVSRARWGEEALGPADLASPPVWLLSLMALRLTDAQILEGWSRAVRGRLGAADATIIIARLRPSLRPDHVSAELREELDLPVGPDSRLVPLREAGAALLLSVHRPARRA